jgi:hypothetical protein
VVSAGPEWAADGLHLEFTHRISFSSALDEVKTFDLMRSTKSVGNGLDSLAGRNLGYGFRG